MEEALSIHFLYGILIVDIPAPVEGESVMMLPEFELGPHLVLPELMIATRRW